MTDKGQRFFPNGCSMCGAEVEFKSYADHFGVARDGRYVYVCSDPRCGAYCHAHRVEKGGSVAGEPMGILADKGLRDLQSYVRSMFSRLWQFRPNSPALINNIFPDFVLSFTSPDGDDMLGMITNYDPESKSYTMETETGSVYRVPQAQTSRINPRSKAYFWMAKQIGVRYNEAKIGMLTYALAAKAASALNQTITEYESNNQQRNSENVFQGEVVPNGCI